MVVVEHCMLFGIDIRCLLAEVIHRRRLREKREREKREGEREKRKGEEGERERWWWLVAVKHSMLNMMFDVSILLGLRTNNMSTMFAGLRIVFFVSNSHLA